MRRVEEMRNLRIRAAALMLAACLALTVLPGRVFAGNPEGLTYQNTHTNTGNQRQDILAVAMTQLGYTERFENDTKFGDWGGYPYQPWCATFISWCARQADISTDILKHSARAKPSSFGIKYYHGSRYTPQPGDLFFTSGFEHVGMVYKVEGSYFIAIEGNAKEYDPDIPPDPDEDSYFVMTNRRRISDHYFGVPNYKGTDEAHTYVKEEEAGHPHKEYYRCTTCGDQYDTGYTAVHSDCTKCMSCGCKASGAGYYMVYNYHDPVRIRTGHSTSADYIGYATQGEVVYVYGTSNGWAYIDFDGKRGHMKTQYLKKYPDLPASPQVSAEKTEYLRGETVTVTWDVPENTEQFRLQVLRNGSIYTGKVMDLSRSYTMKNLSAGTYEVRVTALNQAGLSPAGVMTFTIRDTYTLTYDAGGGMGVPAPQTQALGAAVVVTDQVPVRVGFTFLGWTDRPGDASVVYTAGDEISAGNHITLYPVWLENQTATVFPAMEQISEAPTYLTAQVPGIPASGDGAECAHAWDEGTVIREPSCGGSGVRQLQCTLCDVGLEEEILPTGDHSWSIYVHTDPAAHHRTCSGCGAQQREEHSWDSGAVTEAPTCGDPGAKMLTCTVCSGTMEEEIPATDSHRFEAAWTWDENSHWQACEGCGGRGSQGSHVYDNDCCTVCGVTRAPLPAPEIHPLADAVEASPEPEVDSALLTVGAVSEPHGSAFHRWAAYIGAAAAAILILLWIGIGKRK